MTTNLYGAKETNGLGEMTPEQREAYNKRLDSIERIPVDWSEPHLYITRLRLISDPGFPMWDVSYCHGEIREPGKPVRIVQVSLPFDQLPKGRDKQGRSAMFSTIVAWAKREKVYARGIGILDNISTLI